jgi:hypothetical protein
MRARAWSYNSDVEMVHRTIEDEFYDLENFEGIKDFHQRAASYQAWYNIVRVNSNKDYKSPWQIIRELNPKMDIKLVRLPPLMLDWLGPDYISGCHFPLAVYCLQKIFEKIIEMQIDEGSKNGAVEEEVPL